MNEQTTNAKYIKTICLILLTTAILVLAGIYIKNRLNANTTVHEMDAEPLNMNDPSGDCVITGIWDDDHLEKYKHLIIVPHHTNSNMGTYWTVTEIGEQAFFGNVYLETVYIAPTVTRIRKGAFGGCSSLKSVSYGGTEEQWKSIAIESGNDILLSLPVTYEADMPYYERAVNEAP